MRIYLSGPITNEPNYRRNFAEAQRILESFGHDDIVNPAELCQVVNVERFGYEQIMQVCIDLLYSSDALILLPGWQHSHGCGREWGIAHALDLNIVEFEDYIRDRR